MSFITLANIALAKTDEERKEAERIHREDVKNRPSDAEQITSFLQNCTTSSGERVLKSGEYANLDSGKVTVKKSN